MEDHPRSRGVYDGKVSADAMGTGSSPLARGLRPAAALTAHRLPDTPHIPLQLSYGNGKASGRFQVPPKWMVTPSSALFDELEKLLGNRAVRVNW